MKNMLIGLLLFVFCYGSLYSFNFDAEEYKFEMDIPEGFEFMTREVKDWGGLKGYEAESETYVLAYTYLGETNKNRIYKFGEKETGIKKKYWKKISNSEDENGFEWTEMYKASDGESSIYAILGKHESEEIYYLFFVLAPVESFDEYEEEYLDWLYSCKVYD